MQGVSKQEYPGLAGICHLNYGPTSATRELIPRNEKPERRNRPHLGVRAGSLPRTDSPSPCQQLSNQSMLQRGPLLPRGPLQRSQQLQPCRGTDRLHASGGSGTETTLFLCSPPSSVISALWDGNSVDKNNK